MGCSYLQYRANSFQIVHAVLEQDSLNYCSGEQAQQPHIFLSMFASHGFIWISESGIPHVTLWQGEFNIRWQHLILFYFNLYT